MNLLYQNVIYIDVYVAIKSFILKIFNKHLTNFKIQYIIRLNKYNIYIYMIYLNIHMLIICKGTSYLFNCTTKYFLLKKCFYIINNYLLSLK